ncbi:MAG TPA: DUF362 domain-containing protein, partial [bacterium]|nr:DUF362 domain-containing protein [bacterium]
NPPSKVYFLPWEKKEKFPDYFRLPQFKKAVKSRFSVAVKTHFGEKGNMGYIEAGFFGPMVSRIKKSGAFPFLTDSNTIYVGTRHDAYHHMMTAEEHGFSQKNLGCPVFIADGLRGESETEIQLRGTKHIKTAKIASIIHHSDSLILFSHVKGHELMGFGGALKNLGMGCASRRGKYEIHALVSPGLKKVKCVRCGNCVSWCSGEAISFDEEGYPLIARDRCIGCGQCIIACSKGAWQIPWDTDTIQCQEKMIEYAGAVLEKKKGRVFCFNFIRFVTKECDCFRTVSAPLLPDIGILASDDPVAIDRASCDLVNKKTGNDFWKKIWPEVEWEHQLHYAEELGIGTQAYELVELR